MTTHWVVEVLRLRAGEPPQLIYSREEPDEYNARWVGGQLAVYGPPYDFAPVPLGELAVRIYWVCYPSDSYPPL